MQDDGKERGLVTLIQEGLNHETQQMNNELVDCISVIQKPTHPQATTATVVLNNAYYASMGTIAKDFVLPYEKCGTE